MPSATNPFNRLVLSHWEGFVEKLPDKPTPIFIDGNNLDLASVVAVARYGKFAEIESTAMPAILQSAEAVHGTLSRAEVIYGPYLTTIRSFLFVIVLIFVGSKASTLVLVQVQMFALKLSRRFSGLIRGLHYGIIDNPEDPNHVRTTAPGSEDIISQLNESAVPLDNPAAATCMPEAWVRASMLIRLSSLAKGASGMRPCVLDSLVQLLNKNVVPLVPLRGSISASGDLSPLSYIGGLMQGKPSLSAYTGDRCELRRVVTAERALKEASIRPVDIGPKEGLALVNGTATSAAVASLALHEALCLVTLSQVLTAMSVEALCGTIESFDPFFAEVRPHPGQIEASANILAFAAQSKLVVHNDGTEELSLRQDRYSIRTAAQWIGPVLEDLALSYSQIKIELNSVTDNPLIDRHGRMLHDGNFQARSITSAMEKTRQACETIGQMLFTQCTELINPATNRGLPPNLVVDEPSKSWMWKETDILIAALQSELGFLANPVGNHVKPAEMGNQALNSLALISSRYTLSAIDVLSQLSASHIVALCQALDLRAMHTIFLEALYPDFMHITRRFLGPVLLADKDIDLVKLTLWKAFVDRIDRTTSTDSSPRFKSAIDSLKGLVLSSTIVSVEALEAIRSWSLDCSESAMRHFDSTRSRYLACPDATPFLGIASSRLYKFIRLELGIPFFGEKFIRKAEWESPEREIQELKKEWGGKKVEYQSMGGMITSVYKLTKLSDQGLFMRLRWNA